MTDRIRSTESDSANVSRPSRVGPPRGRGAILFLCVVSVVAILLNVYPAVRLLGSSVVMSSTASVLIGVALGLVQVGLLVSGHARGHDLLGCIGDVWLGIVFQLFVWTAVGELPRLGLWVGDVPGRGWIASVAIMVWVILVLAYGLCRALGPVGVVNTEVHLPRLHSDLDGVRIVQITDTHLSRIIGRRWMARIVQQVNAIDADIYCHTGDLADGSPRLRDEAVNEIGGVNADHKYYITGNHEYFGDAMHWANRMTDLGWHFMHNTHAVYQRGGGTLIVAGIDDPTGSSSGLPGHGPDLGRALEGAPADAAILLLAHQPKQASQAAEYGVDLQLAGHTHGGQMWPFHYLVRADQKYVSGLHQVSDRTQIYVSRGTGFWGPPFRILAPPEVAVLTLRATETRDFDGDRVTHDFEVQT